MSSAPRPPTLERRPTPRRVVAGWLLVALLAVGALVATGEALRHDTPPGGPATPELGQELDPLRGEVECPAGIAREGGQRPALSSGPETPQEVTSNQLYECPSTWDSREVRYVGEVVGPVLDRGDHAWVQLNDDVYADSLGPLPTHRDFRGGNAGVGARLTAAQAARIGVTGGPTTSGDLVEVVATFRRVSDDAEVAVLEVSELQVLREGGVVEQPRTPARRPVALLAAAVALALAAADRHLRRDR